jgi:hypothetical protein
MANGAVQFYGIDSVLDAYSNKGTAAFAIWCGKELLFRYDGTTEDGKYIQPTISEGTQLLNNYLGAMYQGTTAIYTLKTYDELKQGQKIRPSTEYDTAFNFKICPSASEMMGGIGYGGGGGITHSRNPVLAELQKMNERMTALENREAATDDDDESPKDLNEAIIGVLNEPSKMRELIEPVKELIEIGRTMFGFPGPEPSRVVGAVKQIGSQQGVDRETRLANALDTLEQADPQLVEHLEVLARLARTNRAKFDSIIKMVAVL